MVKTYCRTRNFQKKMSKRPLDEIDPPPAKKQRCGDTLDAMKASLEKLMQQATEEHEKARIAAIDSATELEETWQAIHNKLQQEEDEVQRLNNEYGTACQYFEQFETSAALKMLNKASNCELESVKSLSKHREQIENTLAQLKTLRDDLDTRGKAMAKQVELTKKEDHEAYDKFKQAETNVEVITDLN